MSQTSSLTVQVGGTFGRLCQRLKCLTGRHDWGGVLPIAERRVRRRPGKSAGACRTEYRVTCHCCGEKSKWMTKTKIARVTGVQL